MLSAALATASRRQSRALRRRRRAAAHRAPGQLGLIATRSICTCSANASMRRRFSRQINQLSIGTVEDEFEANVRRELTGFQFMFSRKAKEPITYKVARFRQVGMDNPCAHHDALEFPDGRTLLLTHLLAGQHTTVLQLPTQANSLARSETGDREVVAHTG